MAGQARNKQARASRRIIATPRLSIIERLGLFPTLFFFLLIILPIIVVIVPVLVLNVFFLVVFPFFIFIVFEFVVLEIVVFLFLHAQGAGLAKSNDRPVVSTSGLVFLFTLPGNGNGYSHVKTPPLKARGQPK